ncbi:hypothetical protein HA050_00695 [Iodobacter sp. HSC-16F04]|uniref:Uncharacterized protein n=1 Tax=Iodobacter violaceini TaxID=3044271 RepID=A0ABX0KRC6_9NEIS|nr:hypothetical protein [Iodobacter violacea]NHQ84634.1 hypothetical protein [Iodobacter violacea]
MLPTPASELIKTIEEIASLSRDREQFTKRAAEAAELWGAEAIPQLCSLYHGDPCPPPQYKEAFPGLGAWLSAKQFAIFEIYFHLGKAALPELRSVAFGDYDWIQGNALEILCRFAAAGIEREEILQDIQRESPHFRDEAMLYTVAPLIPYEDSTPGLREVLTFLRDQAGFSSAYDATRNNDLAHVGFVEEQAALNETSEIGVSTSHEQNNPWWKLW